MNESLNLNLETNSALRNLVEKELKNIWNGENIKKFNIENKEKINVKNAIYYPKYILWYFKDEITTFKNFIKKISPNFSPHKNYSGDFEIVLKENKVFQKYTKSNKGDVLSLVSQIIFYIWRLEVMKWEYDDHNKTKLEKDKDLLDLTIAPISFITYFNYLSNNSSYIRFFKEIKLK